MALAIETPREPPAMPGMLRGIFRRFRWQILFTYVLFTVENLLRLAQPLVLGIAINDLIHASYRGLFLFLGQHLAHLAIGTLRQMYDTRVFTGIYSEVASDLVLGQRRRDVAISQVSARTAMSRDYVDFFERHLPMAVAGMYSIVGALAFLAWYDWLLVPYCLGLLAPACVLNYYYGRRTFQLSGRLHDQIEREVEVISRCRDDEVRNHFGNLRRWQVRLSDCEAVNFGLMELFVMALMAATLIHYCLGGGASVAPGDVFAVFRYMLMFVMGLDSLPRIVAQLSRLRDINGRVDG